MKIAINTIPLLSPLTGVGNYTYYIAKGLRILNPQNKYTYFYGYYSKKLIFYDEENNNTFYHIKEFIKKIPVLGPVVRRQRGIINFFIYKKPFDIYFEPNFIPINIKAKRTVVAVPDFSFKIHPEWHPKDRIEYFENNFWKNIGRADNIIFISDYIRKCAIEHYQFPEDKLKTIYLGFDKDTFKSYDSHELESIRRKYSLPEKFFLSVGSVEPRKNLRNLIQAYTNLSKNIRKEFKIVLAGFKGWNNIEIMELLKMVKNDVIYLGYVPNSDLGKLYNMATLFVYPSFYEGFGLPPLEAMACGCPVVVSNVTSLPEVCGDAAYYIDPYAIDSITEGIYRVATDDSLRSALKAKGLERARLFSWEKTAKEVLNLFEKALK